jgi:hypothetical protein
MNKINQTLTKCPYCGIKDFKIDFALETNYTINKQGLLIPISDNNLGMSSYIVCIECTKEFVLNDFNLPNGLLRRASEVQNA